MRRVFTLSAILGCLVGPTHVAGQGTGPVGTVVVAHGGGERWNAMVEAVIADVETGGPVEVAYLMGPAAPEHRFQDAVGRLVAAGAGRIAVVPLLVSSYSGHFEQIRYLVGETDTLSPMMHHHLHMAGIERPERLSVPLHLASAMDAAPHISEILAARAAALSEEPEAEALFIIGHGPSEPDEYAAWMKNVRTLASDVGRRLPFRDVKAGLLWDDSPPAVRAEAVRRIREIIELQATITGREVVVVPLLMSRGEVSDEKIPRDLAGLPVRYAGEALLPHPGVARWIEAQVRVGPVDAAAPDR